MCCDISKYFVKNAQFCHFLRGPCIFSLLQFCQKCLILSFCERPVHFFQFFNFVKNDPFCHFWNADFKLWDKYEGKLRIHYMLWYIKLFCQKCSILSFSERAVYFFHFLKIVKNSPFCHFLRGSCIFSLLQFCQKCSILSFSERPVYFFTLSILSKMVHFVIFEKWISNYEISISILCVVIYQTILSKMLHFVSLWGARVFYRFFNFVKNAEFCHFLRGPCGFSFFQIVKNGPFCHFLRGWCIFSLYQFCQISWILSFVERPVYFFTFQYCHQRPILSFWKSGIQIMRYSIS